MFEIVTTLIRLAIVAVSVYGIFWLYTSPINRGEWFLKLLGTCFYLWMIYSLGISATFRQYHRHFSDLSWEETTCCVEEYCGEDRHGSLRCECAEEVECLQEVVMVKELYCFSILKADCHWLDKPLFVGTGQAKEIPGTNSHKRMTRLGYEVVQ